MARIPARMTERVETAMDAAKPLIERIATVGLVQSAVVLAAQTFMALFPLLIAVVAIAPAAVSQAIVDNARHRFGLDGSTGSDLQHLVGSRTELRTGITAIGVIVVLGSATSFTRALQRVYENAWALPRFGLRGSVRGLGWLVGLVAYSTILGLALHLTTSHRPIVSVIRLLLTAAGSFGLWWTTPFVLLCGRVRWRSLLGTGVATAVATLVSGVVSGAVMPRIIHKNEQQFGIIGAAFAIESWLVAIASILVGIAILGALGAQSDSRIGRWARGNDDPEGWRREPRPLRRRKTTPRPARAADPESPD